MGTRLSFPHFSTEPEEKRMLTADSTPEEVVQAQLDAYNAHDIEAFLATYAPDVKIWDHPSTLRMEGHDTLRQRYGALFAGAPDLVATTTTRIAQGRYVIDHETVTGVPGAPMSVAAIYEVRDGLIQNVWFAR